MGGHSPAIDPVGRGNCVEGETRSGVVLYEMVTGRRAFDPPDRARLAAAIRECPNRRKSHPP